VHFLGEYHGTYTGTTMVKNQCSKGTLGFAVLNPGVQRGWVRSGQVLLIWNGFTENPLLLELAQESLGLWN
jgi:hypothetical protein